MDNIDDFMQFKLKNGELFKKAYEITDSVGILSKMYSNQKLTSMILSLNPFIYVDVIYAIERLKTMKMNGIIVNFTDLGICVVFHYDQYRRLLNKITESIDDEELTNSDLHLYQVVLVGQRQKLVLACTNPAYFTKLRRYISEYFKAEVTQDGNQFTVNIYTESEKEFATKYTDFHTFINNKNDIKCYESMKQVDVIVKQHDQYRQYDVSTVPGGTAKNLQDILKVVKTIGDDEYRALKLTININNINGNVNNNCNIVNNNYAQTREQQVQIARQWITDNNPIDGELTSVYYDRYKGATRNFLSHKLFGPLAKDTLKRGYMRSTQGQHW